MREMLSDLYAHQAWADALHWAALEAHAGALEDPAIRERLHHIHLVQRAFLAIERGERPTQAQFEEYAASPMARLKADARRYHEEALARIAAIPDARLGEPLEIPWFKDPPCRISVGQALHQAAMHSHYHRGQNATRLRELGGTPPLTDLIAWYWKGRPAPDWP